MANTNEEQLLSLIKLTRADLYKTIHILNSLDEADDTYGYYSRNYIREGASWIEGTVYALKASIANLEYGWIKQLSTVEQLYMLDIDWSVSRGKVRASGGKKIGTEENLKAFLTVCAKLFNDFDYDLNGDEWQSVKEFFAVRNELMHPKDLSSFYISREKINRYDVGRQWLKKVFNTIMENIVKKIDNEVDK